MVFQKSQWCGEKAIPEVGDLPLGQVEGEVAVVNVRTQHRPGHLDESDAFAVLARRAAPNGHPTGFAADGPPFLPSVGRVRAAETQAVGRQEVKEPPAAY